MQSEKIILFTFLIKFIDIFVLILHKNSPNLDFFF